VGGGRRAPLSNRKTHARLFHSPLLTVKTAMSEKALELEGWKELLKNKTWELTKPNITVRARAGGEREEKKGRARCAEPWDTSRHARDDRAPPFLSSSSLSLLLIPHHHRSPRS